MIFDRAALTGHRTGGERKSHMIDLSEILAHRYTGPSRPGSRRLAEVDRETIRRSTEAEIAVRFVAGGTLAMSQED
jgi:hypothetical protein